MTSSDEIAADLREAIQSGELAPGDEIPGVDALVAQYGSSRQTVRDARLALERAGLTISRGKGRPTVVADQRPLWIIYGTDYDRKREQANGKTTFEVQLESRGERARTEHHHEPLGPAPNWVAQLLGLATDEPTVHVWGEGYTIPIGADGKADPRDERVVGIYDTWTPAWVGQQAPALLAERPGPDPEVWVGGVYSVVERGIGRRLVRRRMMISTRESTSEETARFGLARPGPVIVEDLVAYDAEGLPLVVDRNLKLFGMVQWDLELPIGD